MEYIDPAEMTKELNFDLYNRCGETEMVFEYHTNGFRDIVSICGFIIWDSEDDNREWIKETQNYEPFLPFIKKEFNRIVDMLNSLKFDK